MTNTEKLYQLYQQHPVISTDTRKIAPGSMFFALKGENFDANTFAQQAIEAGAAYAVIDNPAYQLGDQYLLVDDALSALHDLARHHRRQLQIPVIGLTGTNGKTTTKELINSVLSQHFVTHATQGNLNNHIGVPLTILAISNTAQIAVIEMGANHQKEIEMLCTIAQPTHGLITNVGKAHLEGFGGVEGVKKGKGELYDYLKSTAGIAFVNSNSQSLMEMQQARGLSPVFYGDGLHSRVSSSLSANSPYLALAWTDHQTTESFEVASQLTGAYNLDNILAAICIGLFFELSPVEINQGISSYQPKNNRSQLTQTASNTLICDYYNANPSSMLVALENLGKLSAPHKVLILGDMFELGDESPQEHEAVLKKALETDADQRILIGHYFHEASLAMNHEPSTMNYSAYTTRDEAYAALKANPIKNATILIKGSRGMALEKLVELF